MIKEKTLSIQNRADKKILGKISFVENPKGIAFVQHGLSSNIVQPQIKTVHKCYVENGWITVSIDSTNSLNDADGELADFTIGRHKTDLTDVILWAKEQDWFIDKIALFGHSMGAYSALMNASQFDDITDHVIAASTVTSGINLIQAWKTHMSDDFKSWQKQGYIERTKERYTGRIAFSDIQKFIDYSVFDDLNKINCPILFITGENDTSTPPDHVKRAYNRSNIDNNEFIVIDDTDHFFTGKMKAYAKELNNFIK